MFNNHPAIFSTDRIKDKIGDKQGRINDQDGRDELNNTMGNEQSAHDEHRVFGKWKSHSTKNQEAKDADIREVQNNSTGINHTATRKTALLS